MPKQNRGANKTFFLHVTLGIIWSNIVGDLASIVALHHSRDNLK